MKKKIYLISVAAAMLLATACSSETAWFQTVEQGKKTALEQKKDLFILFTGSDWCPWCIRLEQEVLGQSAFKGKAWKGFVPVKLDMLRKTKLPEKRQQYIRDMMGFYGAEGFPTVVLADAAGLPYAVTGYVKGGTAVYLSNMTALQQQKNERDALLQKADRLQGAGKAVVLDELLKKLHSWRVIGGYGHLKRQILDAQPDKNSVMYRKYLFEVELDKATAYLESGKFAEGLAVLQKMMPLQADKKDKQIVYFYAGMAADRLNKPALKKRWLQTAYGLDPAGRVGKYIKQILDAK